MILRALRNGLQRLPERGRTILTTALYGTAAGLVTVAFQLGISWFYRIGLFQLSQHSFTTFAIGSFLIVVGTSLTVGWLLNSFCKEAAGSGIPQLNLAFWKDFGYVPFRVAWVKFVAGILSIGGGSSLGREGPSVQLAGAVASNLAGLAGEPKQTRRAAAAIGASAGLAAAFNTPLAATTFVLEEIIGDLNSRYLGPVLMAAVLGALAVHGIIGEQPSFTLTGAKEPTWLGYAMTPIVAVIAAWVGVYFQRFSLGLRAKCKKEVPIPKWLLPVCGGLITWVLGILIFWKYGKLGVFSLGYDDLSSALAGDVVWKLALLFLIAKFTATFCCYGFGGCGGIFSPTLFFGGMTGVIIAGLLSLGMDVSRADSLTMAVVGMSACLGAVVGAPVTGILIVFEMTHEFALVPALMLGALISQAISRRMNPNNFYEELLHQDGHRIEHVRPPRDLQSWNKWPVSAVTNFTPVVLNDLSKDTVKGILDSHPYHHFPVVMDTQIKGIVSREKMETYLSSGIAPKLVPATTCLRSQCIGDLQNLLIDSPSLIVLVLDDKGSKVVGLVTLHDFLRAESTLTQKLQDEV